MRWRFTVKTKAPKTRGYSYRSGSGGPGYTTPTFAEMMTAASAANRTAASAAAAGERVIEVYLTPVES